MQQTQAMGIKSSSNNVLTSTSSTATSGKTIEGADLQNPHGQESSAMKRKENYSLSLLNNCEKGEEVPTSAQLSTISSTQDSLSPSFRPLFFKKSGKAVVPVKGAPLGVPGLSAIPDCRQITLSNSPRENGKGSGALAKVKMQMGMHALSVDQMLKDSFDLAETIEWEISTTSQQSSRLFANSDKKTFRRLEKLVVKVEQFLFEMRNLAVIIVSRQTLDDSAWVALFHRRLMAWYIYIYI